MRRLCVDTSAYIHFRAGHPEATRLIGEATWVGFSTVVLGELFAGFRLGSRASENEHHLLQLLRMPVVEIQPVTTDVARTYGEIVVELRRKGKPIPQNDLWIAATAMNADCALLTFDRHFESLPRLGCFLLTPD